MNSTVVVASLMLILIPSCPELLANVGCARNILADRLSTLVAHEILTKVPYVEEGQRPRDEYALTERGLALYPILVALMQWGDHWLQAGAPPLVLAHRGCGAPVGVTLRCAAGHPVASARDVEPRPRGPSATRARPRTARRGGGRVPTP
jgi:hypothetical protein